MTKETQPDKSGYKVEERETVTVRFAGDSGDGMQLTGTQFTQTSAFLGNDISTFPDYPAEIRAPAGSVSGVSGFQINLSSRDIRTPGDVPDVLVIMNPAALKVHLKELPPGELVILNSDAFTEANLKKAGYADNPLTDGTLSSHRAVEIPITRLNAEALKDLPLTKKEKDRSKNFYALGLTFWLFESPLDLTLKWIDSTFAKKPDIAEANRRALKAGYNYGETSEALAIHYRVKPAKLPSGLYRQLTGNQGAALGLLAASHLAGRPLFYGSYPITPASEILQELARHTNFDLRTFQAEDEISAIGAAIGASFGGHLGACGTSGPGLALKSEALGLAVMAELPLVIIDVQRAGPSTGMPTKTEQADLFQSLYGRHGESPLAVLAAATPADCFDCVVEAFRIATKYMTPVIVLSDSYLANGTEPWRIPDITTFRKFEIRSEVDAKTFRPYLRDEKTLARAWVVPGMKGLEHRIGGLEKREITGIVTYDPANHEKMVNLRAQKIERIAQEIPPTEIFGDTSGPLLVLGWGSTHGPITSAVERLRAKDKPVSSVHLRYLNPLPSDLGDILGRFDKILLPEVNAGQLRWVLRAKYLRDIEGLNKVQGQPFKIREIQEALERLL